MVTSKYVWISGDYSQAEARVVAWRGPVSTLKTWFTLGDDVHTSVAKMIARVVQENKIQMPRGLFASKHWNTYGKGDPERDTAKNTVHGNNYGLGVQKFAYMTGLPTKYAGILQGIYHGLIPDIRLKYHKWIEDQVNKTGGFTTPMGRRRDFYDIRGPELYRAAYAGYAQSTIGDLLVNTLCEVCEIFENEIPDGAVSTPEKIRSMGFDVRLQLHDNVNVIVPNDRETIEYAVKSIKRVAELPLVIEGETLVIPMDFKIGPTLGDLEDYKP